MFDIRSNIKCDQEELMEFDHILPRKKCFQCGKYVHIAKHCKSVNIVGRYAAQSQNQGEVLCWKCGELGHIKRDYPKNQKQWGQDQEN